MDNFPWGMFITALGIMFAVFYKRCARSTKRFARPTYTSWNIEYTEFHERFAEMGFLVGGIICAIAGILMLIKPSLFD